MSPTIFDQDRPRHPIRLAVIIVLSLYALSVFVAHVIYWTSGVRRERGDPPEFETDPSFPDPRVLHQSVVALTDFAVKVPYQAGVYEIVDALPAELTAAYHEAMGKREARVAVFTRSKINRWRLLTPFPGSWLLRNDFDSEKMLDILRTEPAPGVAAHLICWRLIGWTAARQVRERILAEGRPARLVRLWIVRGENLAAVGREYEELERAGRVVAITVFTGGRSADVQLAFNNSDPSYLALVEAYIHAVDFAGIRQVDNEKSLQACDSLAGSTVDDSAMRVCRELFLVGQWANAPNNLEVAARLYRVYQDNKVADGRRIMQDRLGLLRYEDPTMRRLLQKIESDVAAPEAAAPPAPTAATEEANEGTAPR
jgi:hypothetical protein